MKNILLLFFLSLTLSVNSQTKTFKVALKKAYFYEKTEDFHLQKKYLKMPKKNNL